MRVAWLLVLLVPMALAQDCTKPDDCTDKSRPFCLIYFRDGTYEGSPNPGEGNAIPTDAVIRGTCVECTTDCDCPINMYCGKDFVMPTVTTANNDPNIVAAKRDRIAIAGKMLEGLKFKSKCFDYSVPETTCARTDQFSADRASFTVTQVDAAGTPVSVARKPSGPNVQGYSQNHFCGEVRDYIPSFAPCIPHNTNGGVNGCPATNNQVLSSEDFFRQMGQCTNAVAHGLAGLTSPIPPLCRPTLTGAVPGTFAVRPEEQGFFWNSQEPQWEGYCDRGTCRICKENDKRCTNSKFGIPQICIGGKWVEDYMYDDRTLRTINSHLVGQTTMSTAALISGIIFLGLVAGLGMMCMNISKKRGRGLDAGSGMYGTSNALQGVDMRLPGPPPARELQQYSPSALAASARHISPDRRSGDGYSSRRHYRDYRDEYDTYGQA